MKQIAFKNSCLLPSLFLLAVWQLVLFLFKRFSAKAKMLSSWFQLNDMVINLDPLKYILNISIRGNLGSFKLLTVHTLRGL